MPGGRRSDVLLMMIFVKQLLPSVDNGLRSL